MTHGRKFGSEWRDYKKKKKKKHDRKISFGHLGHLVLFAFEYNFTEINARSGGSHVVTEIMTRGYNLL